MFYDDVHLGSFGVLGLPTQGDQAKAGKSLDSFPCSSALHTSPVILALNRQLDDLSLYTFHTQIWYYCKVGWLVGWLFGFYGISTFTVIYSLERKKNLIDVLECMFYDDVHQGSFGVLGLPTQGDQAKAGQALIHFLAALHFTHLQ